MEFNANKIQNEARKLIKENQINEAIQYLEDFVQNSKVRDDDFTDNLILLSQQNRETKGSNLNGVISYEEYRIEKSRISQRILSLINEIPVLLNQLSNKKEIHNSLPAIYYLEKVHDKNLIEIRGRLINADNLLLTLFEEAKIKERKLIEMEGKSKELEELKKGIKTLKIKIEEEKIRYTELKIKYDQLRREKQKIYELDFQIESLKAKIEGKNKELEVLRESFVMSKQIMANQQKELENLKLKYE